MRGNSNMIMQARDLHLLRELSVMRVVDRDQALTVARFGSLTRVNTRLLTLTRAGLLRRFFLGSGGGRKAVYALSKKGALAADVPMHGPRRPQDATLVADYFVRHQLTVNGIFCTVKYRPIPVERVTFHRWLDFNEPIVSGLPLIPDGYVEFATPGGVSACFLEVDLGHESQTIWKRKAENYLELARSENFRKRFGQERFRVLVLANSERRLYSIRQTVAKITQKIFRFATLDAAGREFFGPIWLRPLDSQPTNLFEKNP
jgi:hypothetical protein